MSEKQPESIPDVMEMMRGLRSQLENAVVELFQGFEECSGLIVKDVEIIRRMDLGKPSSKVEDATRIATVKITVRI